MNNGKKIINFFKHTNIGIKQSKSNPQSKKTYIIEQSKNFRGFKRVHVSTHYGNVQKNLKSHRIPDPSNPEFPYTIDIGDSDIIFKEIDSDNEGYQDLEVYANNFQIGTMFDNADNKNRYYIQALRQGKVDKVHVEFIIRPIISKKGTTYEHAPKILFHLTEECE